VHPAAKTETALPLAAFFQLTEKPHLGHRLPTAALYPGIALANSNTASGLRVCLYDSSRRSRSSGKERDAETGLDWFNVRYLSSAQGRFTSPDDPLAGSDPSDPQSWNLFSYGRNNPLLYTDPTGHDVTCSGDSDNFKCVDNAPPATPPQVDTQTSALGDLSYLFITTVTATAQQTLQAFQPAIDWFSRPRNPLCMAGYTGVGASIGFWAGGGLGTLGLAGGPAVAATIPGGAAGGATLGGGIGGLGGMIMCSSGTGQGGGGTSSEGAQDKKLSPSEIRKLENTTGESAHQIKSEALGTNKNIAQYDLYKDAQGNVFVKGKGGVGESIPTGLKIN
jgi:RHS repeat-associated protein